MTTIYLIPEEMGQKARESLDITKRTRKESGYNICSDSITDVEVGKNGRLHLDNNCPGGKIEAAFHTHPKLASNRDVVPSPNDIRKAVSENMRFFCIGGNDKENDIVRCFDTDDLQEQLHTNTPEKIVKKMIKDKQYLGEHSIRLL